MRIIFSAVLSIPPYTPGSVLQRIHHVLGLQDLGHDVYFVEETYEGVCVDESGRLSRFEDSVNARNYLNTMKTYGLEEQACLIYEGGRETAGLSFDEIAEIAKDADLLINLSGHLSTGPVFEGPRCRAYFDQDPVYTQLWHAEYGTDLNLEHHDVFVTRGLNIGTDATPIPDCSIDWIPTLPAVVLEDSWAPPNPRNGPYSTVASWDVFGDVSYRGEWYGSRREELVRFSSLPSLLDAPFEMMVKAFKQEDDQMRALLESGGWRLADSSAIGDIPAYRDYIKQSRGEIGIAKNAYVKGRSGWFSERSAEYLAAGRPVIAQSTGYEATLPTGVGLLSFSTLEEAADAVNTVEADLAKHARAARELAEEHFSHKRVLPKLLEAVEAKAP
jgi:Glycosyl transferases group 1